LESIACHIPVIATDIPGTREVIQDQVNGWLVNPADTITLHQAILDAYHSPEKREAFSQQASVNLDRFSISRVAEEYESLFLSLDL
jgi:glycosyltransferase involved in cell wall biosynthesis